MKTFIKALISKKNFFLLKIKNWLSLSGRTNPKIELLKKLFENHKSKKRIVVLCNGPSANLLELSSTDLYLVTNSGYKLVKNMDYLYYVNDRFYIHKLLANPSYIVLNPILMYYSITNLHLNEYRFLNEFFHLLKDQNIIMLSGIKNSKVESRENYEEFIEFFEQRGLKVKVQNSGMFLLLFGYYLSIKMNLPLDIYGLDMGYGGRVHFDGRGIIGSSVTDQHVKKNMKIYLDYIYSDLKSNVRNFSNFQAKTE